MALFNERLQTEDIIEIRDVRIISTLPYPSIGVVAGDSLSTITQGVATRTLTLGEKAALDAILSAPSAANPVVLKDDVYVYYQDADLGSILDAVNTVLDLPLTANVGDIIPVLAEGALYRWDGFSWSVHIHTGTKHHTSLINQDSDSSSRHITSTNLNTLNANDHIHGLYFDPTDVDTLNNRIYVSNIYQDDTPVRFSSRGTLPGGLIEGQTYYIVGSTPSFIQVSTGIGGLPVALVTPGTNLTPTGITGEPVLADSHFVSLVLLLDQIISSGSGKIITDNERLRLNSLTPDIQAAMLGTVGTPSNINRYVTDYDTRINTLRNPYATVGTGVPPCSYPGNTQAALDDAIRGVSSFPCTISVGSPAVITADTIYQDNDPVLFYTAGTLPEPLKLDTVYFVVNSTPTSFNVAAVPAGTPIDTTTAGSGNFIVGGNNSPLNELALLPENFSVTNTLTWELQEDGWVIGGWVPRGTTFTCAALSYVLDVLPDGEPVHIRNINFVLNGDGIYLGRDRCRVENCSFQGTGIAITIAADHCSVTDCSFYGTAGVLVDVGSRYAHITRNTFSLTNILDVAIDVKDTGAYILGNVFEKGTLQVQDEYALIRGNTLASNAVFSDLGTQTRYLQSPSYTGDAGGQPFTVRKTIGPASSGADFRGDTHAVFLAAFASGIKELEVLPGTYTFTATVIVPTGVRVTGNKAVRILHSALPVFAMSSNTTLDTLSLEYTVGGVPYTITSSATSNVSILNCNLPNGGIYLNTVDRARVQGCTFITSNGRGVEAVACSHLVVTSNYFATSPSPAISMDVACDKCSIRNNFVQAGAVTLNGSRLVVRGNTFIAGAPVKVPGSIWQGNHPQEANLYGNLIETLSANRHLKATTIGCSRVVTGADAGALSFIEVHESTAATGLVNIPFEVDTTYAFAVTLHVSSVASTGDTYWRVRVRFYDGPTLGAVVTGFITITRTGLTERVFDSGSYTFPASYGVTTPTHYSLEMTRLPGHANDTSTYSADLINATITLRRN